MRDVSPGDDECPVPAPVVEVPPLDRFCDLVMTGGVASGVVYPWAIVELARAYRFRSIGGTSVGAMAAVLAAAAEYGRRAGVDESFEVLRRLPGALGEVLQDKRTRMLSLFQTNQRGKRLITLWGRLGVGRRTGVCVACEVIRVYWWALALGALPGAVLLAIGCGSIVLELLLALGGSLAGLVWAVWCDVQLGLIDNNLGLCKGGTTEAPGPEGSRPGISEWLHEGIQASAGLKAMDRPLTFRDLWCAPSTPGAPQLRCDEGDPTEWRSINLQVITTNVTHGRPYRLPLVDETSRLFFKREELEGYFPKVVLDALVAAARPYAPALRTQSDPASISDAGQFLELPGADLPVVVAARLSLSFPLLFSAVPLWAIDYEAPRSRRDLRRCLFTDGGVSSNFPIHLFDAALPRWPTFGLWLDRRNPYRPNEDVWLPDYNGEGWGDNWNRFDRAAAPLRSGAAPSAVAVPRDGTLARLKFLWGFLKGIATDATDWHDRTSFRLPHVRNRVARLMLQPNEGGLNIGMPREQILDMAGRYGTQAGQLFVKRYADADGGASPAWREQRWVRLVLLINVLRERLAGLTASAEWSAHTAPMSEAIAEAKIGSRGQGPIRDHGNSNQLNGEEARTLRMLLDELERLGGLLQAAPLPRFKPVPAPELRLRAPL